MDDTAKYITEVHEKDDTELSNKRVEIYNYLLGIGADKDTILELTVVDTELAIREFKKELGLS